ncbi:MAG: hypothetical protein PHF37_07320 [Phycisphaerae bacterium]|nr:hypothetical protein [Phycisphaerae bacterium]
MTPVNDINGLIDEVAVFNRALTAEQIQYNMYHKLTGGEDGLVGYWDFDEGAGDIAYDKSGSGNDGTLGSAGDADDSDPNWIQPGAPVICTRPALAKRNIVMAKDIKEDILDDLNFAMKAEVAAGQMLVGEQMDKNSPFRSADTIRARIQTCLALAEEKIAKSKIISSIEYLKNAIEHLNDSPADETANSEQSKK